MENLQKITTSGAPQNNPMSHIVYPSPRVSQLDAHILDNELFSLLKQQLSDVFLLHSNRLWSYNQHPELWSLILNLVVFKLTTLKTGSSYGLKLQNLKLTNSRTGKIIGNGARTLLFAAIVGEYLFKKFESYLYAVEGTHRGSRTLAGKLKEFFLRHKTTLLSRTNDTIKLLNLANFVLFLVHGRYPSVVHRVLGISLTPVIADLLKFNGDNVNFEFQNRQLVWNVMTEFLVFTLPLLNLRKWSRLARSAIPYKKHASSMTSKVPLPTPHTNLPISHCAICKDLVAINGIKSASTYVTNPSITNCGHIFCYVCLATRFNAIESGSEEAEGCPRCRVKLTSFKLYSSEQDVDADAIMVTYEDAESDEEEPELSEKNSDGHYLPNALPNGSDFELESEDELVEEDFDNDEDLEEEMEDDSYGEDDDEMMFQ